MIPLKALQDQVKTLVDDLRVQVGADDDLCSSLTQEYERARTAQRTAGTFESWLGDILDQAAVAWVLGCVFVRFCEDNRLVKGLWIGGPSEEAPVEGAVHRRQAYLIAHHDRNDRHWLREAFTHLSKLGATGKIFDQHNPIWRFPISGQAAENLSEFFRRGDGFASVESPGLDTRFLGDLYQDLSAHARETYALLQTPDFVEEFILDRSFEPAYREFGLDSMKVIDPTCGSGHFLLGAFDRLIARWKAREPATETRVLVQRALDQVTGVDINPFAVAIARFRLMIAALNACGLSDLEKAPAYSLRLATGDSLLEWGELSRHQGDLLGILDGGTGFAYATEDADVMAHYLKPGTYTVVVGNPPYITVKDRARSETYRHIYPDVCHLQYQLTVPFAKRFFELARQGDRDGLGAGWVGQITANGFMKREFGAKLINNFFAGRVELVEVVDASGADIPGHGTPPIILIGRNNRDRRAPTVRTVLGVRGEAGESDNPGEGPVWKAILEQIDRPGSESRWIEVMNVPRERLSRHPWSLSGGGSAELMDKISSGSDSKLGKVVKLIGRTAHTGSDDGYFAIPGTWKRSGVGSGSVVPLVTGDAVRDYVISADTEALFPYDESFSASIADKGLFRSLWPSRAVLSQRREPGGTHGEIGLTWYEWSRWHPERYSVELGIGMAFVATHNHFCLSRERAVFKQSAPAIKLPEESSVDDYISLLGLLNSSTVCFWLKQVSQPKGGTANSSGGGNRWNPEAWFERFEFTGTKARELPLPSRYPLELSRVIDNLAQRLAATTPQSVCAAGVPSRDRLVAARSEWELVRSTMIATQEEIDWKVYGLYGLVDDNLQVADFPALRLGERAFEILLARKIKAGSAESRWFSHHDSTPIIELPRHWPNEYRAMVEQRIAVIESDRNVALIERPECKRRWATKGWDALQAEALSGWLLDRLGAAELWGGAPTPLSVAQLADKLRHDEEFRSVLALWVGSDQYELVKVLGKLVADDHVPYLPPLRYKPTGLRKRAQWARTWDLQRREDAGEKLDIPVPPIYKSADFFKPSFWRNRGKLDVPKERFVSYPAAGRDGDATELLGWGGWDHLAQAQALATVYLDRKNQVAWPPERLLPLLAGLAELEPWLKQWHSDPRPGFPGSPAQFFTALVDTELASLGSDRVTLTALRGLT